MKQRLAIEYYFEKQVERKSLWNFAAIDIIYKYEINYDAFININMFSDISLGLVMLHFFKYEVSLWIFLCNYKNLY